MTRLSLAVLLAVSAFLVAGAAQAKAPPDGVDVCGASACAHLGFNDAEQLWMLFHDGNDGRPAPAPFYVMRWHWAAGENESAYLIPSGLAIRSVMPISTNVWKSPPLASRIRRIGRAGPWTRSTDGSRR